MVIQVDLKEKCGQVVVDAQNESDQGCNVVYLDENS